MWGTFPLTNPDILYNNSYNSALSKKNSSTGCQYQWVFNSLFKFTKLAKIKWMQHFILYSKCHTYPHSHQHIAAILHLGTLNQVWILEFTRRKNIKIQNSNTICGCWYSFSTLDTCVVFLFGLVSSCQIQSKHQWRAWWQTQCESKKSPLRLSNFFHFSQKVKNF